MRSVSKLHTGLQYLLHLIPTDCPFDVSCAETNCLPGLSGQWWRGGGGSKPLYCGLHHVFTLSYDILWIFYNVRIKYKHAYFLVMIRQIIMKTMQFAFTFTIFYQLLLPQSCVWMPSHKASICACVRVDAGVTVVDSSRYSHMINYSMI